MENWADWIYNYFGMSHSFQYKVLSTIVLAIVIFGLRWMTRRLLISKIEDIKVRYNWTKGISYFSYILFLFLLSPIWISELRHMGTFLGLLTAGLAVALKDPIANIFAWIYILVRKPFEMGDRVQIGESEGDILDISFFEFTMMEIKNWVQADQSTGRIIHIPNGMIFSKPSVNYSQAMNYIWNEIPILVTFESNWRKAKKIFLEIEENELKKLVTRTDATFGRAMNKYHIYYSNITPTVYTTIRPNGILLTLRYLCNPKNRRDSEQIAIELILEQFEKHEDLQFAYPTTRFVDASQENQKPMFIKEEEP